MDSANAFVGHTSCHERVGDTNMNIERRKFDTLVIGAGGSGLRAALQMAQAEAKVADADAPADNGNHASTDFTDYPDFKICEHL